MLLLHIADIHFRAPQCLNPDTDPDLVYRTRMVRDLRDQVQALGPVGAILIGGDVAFKGAPEEYRTAMSWIKQLAAAAECPLARVFVIPGNHDVDRAVARTPAVRNAQHAIIRAHETQRASVLREQFEDSETGGALMRPVAAYNEFAKFFNCQVYAPDRLYWKQELALGGGLGLRLHGLSSTLLSGLEGGDDLPRALYLSPMQTVLNPEDAVVNLVLVHHPPDWCMDCDDVEDRLNNRAAIHKYTYT